MCEPISVGTMLMVTGGMAAGGAASGIIGENTTRQLNKHAEDQKRNAVDDQIIENRMRSTKDFLRKVRLEQLAQTQETAALAEQSQDIHRETDGAKGTAQVSAADRGVGGNSIEMLLADYEFQQSQEVGRLRMNQEMKNQQHTEEIGGFKDEFDFRVASVKPYVPRVQPPVDYFGKIFGAGATTASAAMPLLKRPT